MREIKFRAWDGSRMRLWESIKEGEGFRHWLFGEADVELMQFTGLKDKNGKEIYEGDLIRYRRPYRSTQTHTGDNIPNGSYTEPMEPEIETIESEVSFKDGIFGIESSNDYSTDFFPLVWMMPNYDEDTIKSEVAINRRGWENAWDDPEEGDLQYLLENYNLKDVDELVDYCNCFEIIGNVHQNPDLLK